MSATIQRVLVANRGEIAVRVLRTCRELGLGTVAVFSDVDRGMPHVGAADEAVRVGPAPAGQSYLDISALIAAAHQTGADAVHPGYGFLAENAEFVTAVEGAGLTFIGPTAETMRAMGDKAAARALMQARGVPVVPGYSGADQTDARFAAEAEVIGYPVLVKATAGGGGKGMSVVRSAAALAPALATARRLAASAFGDQTLLLEKYLERPRHVEVQILGDGRGAVVHCFERECSVQRRFQKIIEETPSPALDARTRAELCAAGVSAGEALDYRGAGTVEFILDAGGAFYFLEVNTRLQVEHPVTEQVTGLDLVAWQLRLAQGFALPAQAEIATRGHALECRLYAEDAEADFRPAAGTLLRWRPPTGPNVRVDSGVAEGAEIGVFYDPLLAKIITWGDDRASALQRMRGALRRLEAVGLTTNQAFLSRVLDHRVFAAGEATTHFISEHPELLEASIDQTALRRRAAMVAVIGARKRKAASAILPALRSGFRNNGYRAQRTEFLVAGVPFAVEYTHLGDARYAVTVGDSQLVLQVLSEGERYTADVDGIVRQYALIEAGDAIHVGDGHGWTALTVSPSFPAPIEEARAGGCVAPMPGRVAAVHVRVGDVVVPGQTLVVLEAMKMEQSLTAPRSATVVGVDCAADDVVSAGAVLVRLSEETD